MNKTLISLIALFSILIFQNCSKEAGTNPEIYVQLDSLYRNKDFFKLKEEFTTNKTLLNNKDRLIIQAFINAVFNNRYASNFAVDSVMTYYNTSLSDSLKAQLLDTKVNNSMFMGEYKSAFHTTQELLKLNDLNQDEKDDYENSLKIYNALQDSPKQTVVIKESSIPIVKDIAGLSRIPVNINQREEQAVFDTGANLSVITDSLAMKSGLSILKGTFKVTALTGNEVESQIALADSLKIGNSLFKNVVFLVFPESSLSFPAANYKIDLIIGFPVIHDLKEVSIINNSVLYIPEEPGESHVKNMALDFLTPVVAVVQDSKSLPFTFDTGASSTQLYRAYYNLHEETIREHGIKDSVLIGGAGGSKTTAIYKNSFSASIAQQPFKVDTANIFFNDDLKKHLGIYGNLGQDVLHQFDTLTMNFDKMFLKLR